MRDCIFLLADKNMEAVFTGFLTREKFYLSLGISKFNFDPKQDIIVDESGNYPGIYTRGHELIRSYQTTHKYAVIVLDNAWDGSPGVKKIETNITNNLIQTGWNKNQIVVIVINPELEAWILQDNPHVAESFRYKNESTSLKEWLILKGLWDKNKPKSDDPKKAIEVILKFTKTPRSSAIYQKIASKISVKGCQDLAFKKLVDYLKFWFP
ncbi:hypothetical protein [Geminocystis sp.]|uniref:methylation-associated defense system protein MAD4 n=1 Tax=Geminocystis sp. TaxID=2664100 RepID=UPI0035934CCF